MVSWIISLYTIGQHHIPAIEWPVPGKWVSCDLAWQDWLEIVWSVYVGPFAEPTFHKGEIGLVIRNSSFEDKAS